MSAMNRVFLMGNLTRDPELRQTQSGSAVTDLGLAVSESYTNKEGQTVETTVFTDVAVWGPSAEACKQYLAKGSPVLVEGKLELNTWQTKDGQKQSKLRVRADRVHFLGRPRNGAAAPGKTPPKPVRREPVVAAAGTDHINF
jgi:single-strand DNA-binding protein